MKRIFSFFITLLMLSSMNGQDISGKWEGILNVSGQKLRLVFNISQNDKGYTGTMDSPDQGAKGIPVSSVTFDDNKLSIEIEGAGVLYNGILNEENKIEGTFNQGGLSMPMNLTKGKAEEVKLNRPQEPLEPFSYHSEDVKFENTTDGVTLAGTLTLPKKEGSFPAVILISGSGPQDRNQEILGHKPFLVLADHLAKEGIAVLRYDDRGTAESTGDFKTASSLDFAKDTEAAVAYLKSRKEINKDKIGLLGHSEGGLIAPIVASRNKNVSFIVLMAGPGLRGDQILLLQKKLIELKMGVPAAGVEHNQKIFGGAYKTITDEKLEGKALQDKLTQYFKTQYGPALPADQLTGIVNQISNPWMVNFMRIDPKDYLSKVKCPVFALFGEKDLQVPPKENLAAIKEITQKAGNKDVITKELKGMNHLFQECETGLPNEYGKIEQTLAPLFLEEVNNWIQAQVKK